MELRYVPGPISSSGKITQSEILQKELDWEAKNSVGTNDKIHIQKIKNLFEELINQSGLDNFYWQFCPTDVYCDTFNIRMNAYLSIYKDAKPSDFNLLEIKHLTKYTSNFKYMFTGTERNPTQYYFDSKKDGLAVLRIGPIIDKLVQQNISYSIKRKIEFIKKINADKINPKESNEISFDFSENTDAEKIAFLYELGILDYIKQKYPLGISTNKLAEIISSFTGINQTTAQSYLNPIFSHKVDLKKSPLTNKNLKIVRDKLLKMGLANTKPS